METITSESIVEKARIFAMENSPEDNGKSLKYYKKHIEDVVNNLIKFNVTDESILASDEPRFNEYERQIRAEYAHVNDYSYKIGRIDFILKMLERPSIYLTVKFQKMFEDRARKNLENLLLTLRT